MQLQNIAVGLNEILHSVLAVGPVMQDKHRLVRTVVPSEALPARGPVSTSGSTNKRATARLCPRKHASATIPHKLLRISTWAFSNTQQYTHKWTLHSKVTHKQTTSRNVIFEPPVRHITIEAVTCTVPRRVSSVSINSWWGTSLLECRRWCVISLWYQPPGAQAEFESR